MCLQTSYRKGDLWERFLNSSQRSQNKIESNMNETINGKRYQFILWFYKIRTQYPRMGLFQPDFLFVIFRKMMPSKYNRSDEDIKIAVNDWCDNPVAAAVQYGHISKWNTSLVTNMKNLFKFKRNFNDDISKWDVSSVTNMYAMFSETPFDGDISGWNVSSVTNMGFMFSHTPFNGNISGWNVSSVTNMRSMLVVQSPLMGISLDGMSAVLLICVPCSTRHPSMGISQDGMSAMLLS